MKFIRKRVEGEIQTHFIEYDWHWWKGYEDFFTSTKLIKPSTWLRLSVSILVSRYSAFSIMFARAYPGERYPNGTTQT